ncbi:MAG TPA: cytochrome c family protein, partial [Acetobacteraceae bacterium]|nr:cytochrome c family protein [Acetobacteraceae bacterium]
CLERATGWRESRRMDSMDVNKAVAAVLVAGIAFFITGMIGDNLVYEAALEKPVISIQGVQPAESTGGAPKPAELPPIAPLLASANVQKGDQFVHQVCSACHSFNKGGKPIVGPNLYGIVGAPHDHEAGFDYSAALQKFKGQPWTFEALNKWLHDPATYAPGTRMTYAGIKNNQTRADVIDYLRTLSDNPEPLPKVEAATSAPAGTQAPAPAAHPAATAPTTAAAPPPAGASDKAPAASPPAAAPPAASPPAAKP